jgi:hypothetical protein
LAAGPQADQEAGDDRAVRLNLDAILVGRTEGGGPKGGGQSRLVPRQHVRQADAEQTRTGR